MTGLSVENLIKKYGSHTVLDFPELRLQTGIYWVKGGNGTGKTTLFRILSGQTPFSGSLILNGISIRQNPIKYRSMISYAEAEPQYPEYITGNDLLNYHLKIRNVQKASSDEIIARFGMSDFMAQKIGSYSSGMLKKLSLICAFTGNIELYILDEPLITIDTAAAEVLYQLIKEYSRQGKSFLLSSHQDIDPLMLPLNGSFQIKDRQLRPC